MTVDSGSQIKKGAALNYVAVAFNAVAGLVYTPWMVQNIGAGDYGLYTLAISIVNFFLMDFGLSDAVARFLSRFYANGEEDRVAVFLGIVYKMFAILAACIAVLFIVILLLSDTIYANLGERDLAKFKVLFAIAAAYSVLSFPFMPFRGILQANERFVGLNACNLLQKVSTVLLIVACLIAGTGVYALVAVNAISAFVFTVARYVIVRLCTSARADFGAWDGVQMRELIGFSAWVTLIQTFQRMVFAIAPSILAALSSTWEVALFGLASSIEGYVWTLASALNGMFIARVANVGKSGSEQLQNLMQRVGRIQVMIIGFAYLCLVCFGERFVECWMGADYEMLWPCALLLVFPSLLELPQLIGDTALVVGDYVKSKAIAYSVMATVNVVGLVVLCGPYGAVGASLSICLAYLLRTALMDVAYKRKLGVKLGAFFYSTFLRWIPIAAVLGVAGLCFSNAVPIQGWLGLILLLAAFVVVYVLAMWVLYMDDSEHELLLGFLRREK